MTTQQQLVELLIKHKKKIACAESCTGGLISKLITDISGSSMVFDYGACTYANEAKIKLLNVDPSTLAQCGAVSYDIALQMAKGMLTLSCSDIAISTTGIAGPTGGTQEKPVGLVYVAIYCNDGYHKCKKLLLCDEGYCERDSIRHAASNYALGLAIEYLEKLNECN